LQRQESFDRWLDLYRTTAYAHPTHRIVGLFAERALLYGQQAGRERQILDVLRHVASIPLPFESKERILALINGATCLVAAGQTLVSPERSFEGVF
jgi:hypothetical protein